jgi:uncharacterized protein YhhL (DUF1145 family)
MDLAFRIYGPAARYFVNVLQALLLLILGQVIIQAMLLLAKGRLYAKVCCIYGNKGRSFIFGTCALQSTSKFSDKAEVPH